MTEFGHAELGDHRRLRRLLCMAAVLARAPAGKVTSAFRGPAERQGAYGLIESDAVSVEAIAESSRLACVKRSRGLPFVFVPVDGSSLWLAEKRMDKGFGHVGSIERGARGLKVISALGIAPDGTPLGLAGQVWWARTGRAADDPSKLRYSEKETQHWLDTIDLVRKAYGDVTKCWFQIDREGDAWPILLDLGRNGHWFTVRSSHDRRIAGGKHRYLRREVAHAKPIARLRLEVPRRPDRPRRVALLEVRSASVTLDLRDKRTDEHMFKDVNVVHVAEVTTAPEGDKIEWYLLTNHSVETAAEALAVVLGYAQRWKVEEFHRTWKTGACNVEQNQLRATDHVIKWAGILAAVAVRVERLKHLARTTPEVAASTEFTEAELKALVALRFTTQKKRTQAAADLTIGNAVLWLAELGGYTGKSSGGPPGSITIARGLRDLEVAARIVAALGGEK